MLSAAAPPRERELMQAAPDDELIRIMLANVKVNVPGKALQMQKAAVKARQKQARKEETE